MGKIVECAKVDPSSGCKHEEEVLKNAVEHATWDTGGHPGAQS